MSGIFLRKGCSQSCPATFVSGEALTRQHLVVALRSVLARADFKLEEYAGHSFRIGAATTAAVCGVPVDTIKIAEEPGVHEASEKVAGKC